MKSKTCLAALCMTLVLAVSAFAAPPHRGPPHMPPPPPPPGGPGCHDNNLPSEVLALRQEIAAIKLDRLLDLTKDQAQAIHLLTLQAQARKDEIEREKKKREPLFIEAMTAARDDLKRDGKVSDATAQKLRDARGEMDVRALRDEFEQLRAQVDAILTDDQKAAFFSFDPRPLALEQAMLPPPPPGCEDGCEPPMPPGKGGGMHLPPPPPRHPHPPRPPRENASMMLLSEEFIPFLEARMNAK